MVNDLFKDARLNTEMKREGVVLVPFLDSSELKKLTDFYHELHGDSDPPTMSHGIHMTIWHSDIAYKLRVKETLEKLIHDAAERTFANYRIVVPQFIVKKPGVDTTFHIHQDWSIVDESKYVSFNIWIPLQYVDETNGAMWIVKRSHLINRPIRGAGYLYPDYKSLFDSMEPYRTCFPMKAGEALMFYHSTLHGSSVNQSAGNRVVIQISALPKEAPFHIYFQQNATEGLKVFHPKDDFSYRYDKLLDESHVKAPSDMLVDELPPFKVKEVTIEEVLDAIQ